jgi:DNA-binding CsgD family transcriptional regulator
MARGRKKRDEEYSIAKRQKDVSRLYLKGFSQYEIAEKLDISQPTVSNDIKRLKTEQTKFGVRNLDQRLGRLLAESALIKEEAWKAWVRSTMVGEIEEKGIGDRGFLDTIGKQLIYEARVTGLLKGEGIIRTRQADDETNQAIPIEPATEPMQLTQNIQINQFRGFQEYSPQQLELMKQLRDSIQE